MPETFFGSLFSFLWSRALSIQIEMVNQRWDRFSVSPVEMFTIDQALFTSGGESFGLTMFCAKQPSFFYTKLSSNCGANECREFVHHLQGLFGALQTFMKPHSAFSGSTQLVFWSILLKIVEIVIRPFDLVSSFVQVITSSIVTWKFSSPKVLTSLLPATGSLL